MPQTNFDKFLQLVATDEKYRELCAKDPAAALSQAGIPSTDANVAALKDARQHLSEVYEHLGKIGELGPMA